jgi:hypothetical protein
MLHRVKFLKSIKNALKPPFLVFLNFNSKIKIISVYTVIDVYFGYNQSYY